MMLRYLAVAAIGMSLVLSGVPAAFAEDEDQAWETSVYPEDQIFPSLLISTATQGVPEDPDEIWDVPHLGDPNGLIGALFHAVKKGDRVRVVVKANSFMDESAFEGTAPKTKGDLLVHPKVKYRYDALAKTHQQQPLSLSIETWLNGESLGEQTVTVDVRSINDCLYAVLDDDGNVELDANWNFAAYVNENHPWVDDILREALETGVVDAFDGYQSEDPEQVLMQIYAVWNVMQRHGMKYSSITTTADESDTVLAQHVRLFDESVKAHQANCVDGSVLLAAVLRKIGLDTYLVSVPGHMYLAVNLADGDEDTMVGIETTMMGQDNLGEFDGLADMSKKQREKLKNQASFKTFEAAVDTATQDLDDHAEDFEDEDNADYQLVNISEARAEGIKPLGCVQP
ncbi:MAG: hypothetical protein ACREKL_14085 [Chthoniobacterales bacterium]